MASRRDIQLNILEKALKRVPFDGWTSSMLATAAEDAGFPTMEAERVFPGGATDAILLFIEEADAAMLSACTAETLGKLKVRERIALLVRTRLEQSSGNREAIRRAVAHLSLPQNIPASFKSLWNTVDAMWLAAGDTSTDFNWYSKRILLSKVYSSTLLFWLNDESDNYQETWQFLDRRIAEVLKIGKNIGETKSKIADFSDKLIRRVAAARR